MFHHHSSIHQNVDSVIIIDAPLDMRMDTDASLTAYDVVNDWSYEDLVRIFFRYGEEKFSKRIARKIEETREKAPIQTTAELAELIKTVFPLQQEGQVGIQRNGCFKQFELQ